MQNDYISPFREKKEVEEQQTMQYDNDPLMKKVAKKLKSEIFTLLLFFFLVFLVLSYCFYLIDKLSLSN